MKRKINGTRIDEKPMTQVEWESCVEQAMASRDELLSTDQDRARVTQDKPQGGTLWNSSIKIYFVVAVLLMVLYECGGMS
jgi:hypothetical protein